MKERSLHLKFCLGVFLSTFPSQLFRFDIVMEKNYENKRFVWSLAVFKRFLTVFQKTYNNDVIKRL